MAIDATRVNGKTIRCIKEDNGADSLPYVNVGLSDIIIA